MVTQLGAQLGVRVQTLSGRRGGQGGREPGMGVGGGGGRHLMGRMGAPWKRQALLAWPPLGPPSLSNLGNPTPLAPCQGLADLQLGLLW